MARALLVGCGCRARAVGSRLLKTGWEVRGTSRREAGLFEIEEAGIEPMLADPTDPASVLDLVADVTVVAWLLGSAEGSDEELAAIHGSCLERVLERLVETPVRGFVYDGKGSVDPIHLAHGRELTEMASETWRLPNACVLVDPLDEDTWGGHPNGALEIWTDAVTHAISGMLEPAD